MFRFFFSILVEEQMWDHYFGRLGVTPLILDYEDLAGDPQRALGRVAAHVLGDACPPSGVGKFALRTPLARLSDDYSVELEKRFLEDLYQIGVTAHWETRQDEVSRWLGFFQQHLWRPDRDAQPR